jgi:hypothetical protein
MTGKQAWEEFAKDGLSLTRSKRGGSWYASIDSEGGGRDGSGDSPEAAIAAALGETLEPDPQGLAVAEIVAEITSRRNSSAEWHDSGHESAHLGVYVSTCDEILELVRRMETPACEDTALLDALEAELPGLSLGYDLREQYVAKNSLGETMAHSDKLRPLLREIADFHSKRAALRKLAGGEPHE